MSRRPLFARVCLFVCSIALDPTFGSFTLLELVSLVKVFRLEWIFFWCSECEVGQ
jgi:hypothetical protein